MWQFSLSLSNEVPPSSFKVCAVHVYGLLCCCLVHGQDLQVVDGVDLLVTLCSDDGANLVFASTSPVNVVLGVWLQVHYMVSCVGYSVLQWKSDELVAFSSLLRYRCKGDAWVRTQVRCREMVPMAAQTTLNELAAAFSVAAGAMEVAQFKCVRVQCRWWQRQRFLLQLCGGSQWSTRCVVVERFRYGGVATLNAAGSMVVAA